MTKILSLCSGAGGIDEGLDQCNLETTLAVDYDPKRPNYSKVCLETNKINHSKMETLWGDIQDHEKSFGKFDIVVGGVPCPEFSNANTNKTYDDTLVKCFWRIVEETKAKYWLLENVPGIIKVCKLRNFLINTADYGTPQKRIRRFYTNLPMPEKTHMEKPQMDLFGVQKKKWVSVKEALGLKRGFLEDRKSTFGEKYKKVDGKFRDYSINEPCFTLITDHRIFLIEHLKEKNPKIFAKHPLNTLDEPARTMLSKDRGFQGEELISDGEYARKLTNAECAILQGFPKDYKFVGTKTEVKRQIGNAVPPIQAYALAVKIDELLHDAINRIDTSVKAASVKRS